MKALTTHITEKLKINKNYSSPVSDYLNNDKFLLIRATPQGRGVMTFLIVDVKFTYNEGKYNVDGNVLYGVPKQYKNNQSLASLFKIYELTCTYDNDIMYGFDYIGLPETIRVNIFIPIDRITDVDSAFKRINWYEYRTLEDVAEQFNISPECIDKITGNNFKKGFKYEIQTKDIRDTKEYIQRNNSK